MLSNGFRFIVNVSHPADAVERRSQRRSARSHTTKLQHANVRRLRTIQYQSSKAGSGSLKTMYDTNESTALSLMLASGRKDPFMSFASPLNPVEHFLLDHCKP
jgi:hypothetical protein